MVEVAAEHFQQVLIILSYFLLVDFLMILSQVEAEVPTSLPS